MHFIKMEVFKNSSRPNIISSLSSVLDILLTLFILRKLRGKHFRAGECPRSSLS